MPLHILSRLVTLLSLVNLLCEQLLPYYVEWILWATIGITSKY